MYYVYIYIYIYIHICTLPLSKATFGRMETVLAATVSAAFRARAARVCCCKYTGRTTKEVPLRK